MRRLIGGAMAAALIVVLTPAAAYADGEWWEEESSPVDTTEVKSVAAICPEGTVVVGAGGRTVQAGGGAVLTGIVPDTALTRVTAVARALPGHATPWGVTATAVCAERAGYQPELVSALGISSAVARCPDGKIVYSTGYVIGGTATPYVYSVVPSQSLATVTVNSAQATKTLAIAVCGNPVLPHGRTEASTRLHASAPTIATAPPLVYTSWVFGAGVESSRAGLFVDALGPYLLDDGSGMGAKARLAYLPAVLPLPRIAGMAATADDEDMTVYGVSIGSWY